MDLYKEKSVGLDIADRTIEVIELTQKNGKKIISSMGRVHLVPEIVRRGRIIDEKRLRQAVKKVLATARPSPIQTRKIVFGLPESQVYLHIFELPPHDKGERDDLVAKEAQESIPLQADDMLFSYSVLSTREENTEILLVVISREVLSEWQGFFQSLQLEVEYFDVETLATFRGLFVEKLTSPHCVVDIGGAVTSISIFDERGLQYSYSLAAAGDTFTGEIAKNLKVTKEHAEDLKVRLGLSDENEKIFFILIKTLQPIVDGVKVSLEYFKEKTGRSVSGIVLVGGSSKLKGLTNYFKEQFHQSVWLGESILLRSRSSLEYIEAIGLALRGFDREEDRNDPVIRIKSSRTVLSAIKKRQERGEKKMEDVVLLTPVELEQIKKLRFEKWVLVVVLIVGIVGILLTDWYTDSRNVRQWEELQRTTMPVVSEDQREVSGEEDSPRTDLLSRPIDEVNTPTSSPALQNLGEDRGEDENDTFIIITETETGWLNVRSGPGTAFPIVKKIYPGEQYPLLSESDGWQRIELLEGVEGWVSSRYTLIQ